MSKTNYKKFEVCLVDKIGIAQVSKINYLKESQPQNYANSYKDKLYCPYCNIAKLTLVSNVKTPHLKTKNGEVHRVGCTYDFERINKKVLSEIIKELDDKKYAAKISNIFNALMEGLEFTDQVQADIERKSDCDYAEKLLEATSVKCNGVNYAFSIKAINRICEDDFEKLRVYYGKVKVKWHDGSKGKMLVVGTVSGKYKCSISCTNEVIKYLLVENPTVLFKDQKVVDLVFLGEIKKSGNFSNIKLRKSYYMSMRIYD